MRTRPLARLLLLAAALLVAVVGLAAPSSAQDDEGGLPTMVRAVNSRNPSEPSLQLMTSGDAAGVTMTQSGEEIDVGDVAALSRVNIVAVVDTGSFMAENGGLEAAKVALTELNASLRDNDRLGLVAAGDTAKVLSDPSTSRARLDDVITGLAPSPAGEAQLWTAIRSASDLLGAEEGGQANLLVLTSGQDVSDGDQRDAAVGTAVATGLGSFVVGFGQDFEAPGLADMVDRTGGILRSAPADGYQDAVTETGGWIVQDQYTVDFSPVVTDPNEIASTSLTVGDTTIDFAYVTGTFAAGAEALQPFETSDPGGLSALPLFSGSLGRILLLALVLVAVAGIVYSLAMIFGRDESALSNVLLPYSEGVGGDTFDDDEEGGSSLARTALLQRAVSLTEQVADSQGYLSRTEGALERADLPLRAAEALFFYVCVVVLTAIVGLVFFSPMGALVLVLIAALIPPAVVNYAAGSRRKKFQAQLPDMLQLLAGTLRAGYSLMQGVEAVSQEVAEPMGKELRRVVTEARLGRPLEEALDGVAERMASPDFAWAVMAIRIQREVGGNLSELLMTVADTMVQRERLRRDINSLTAEGRMSAIVLGLLPVGLGLFMFMANPDYMGRLFDTTLGNILLALAIMAMGIGFVWMRQIIKIEI